MAYGFGVMSDLNGRTDIEYVGWYPGQYLVVEPAKERAEGQLKTYAMYAGIAVVAGIVIYGIYSMTR
jgi:hypothetical protein